MLGCFPGGRVDKIVKSKMQKQGVIGAAVALLDHGTKKYMRAYGSANLEHGVRVNQNTVFNIGALAEQFTAIAVLLRIEDMTFSLHDNISTYFSNIPADWLKITIYHLLTHTSGLCEYAIETFNQKKEWSNAEIIAHLSTLPTHCAPGLRFFYSHTNYVLLGLILEATGSSRDEILITRVFKTLGMKTAQKINARAIVRGRAAGYRGRENCDTTSTLANHWGDAGLYMSIKDVLRWEKAMFTQTRILKKETWMLFSTPGQLKSGAPVPFGCGLELPPYGSVRIQQGKSVGFSSCVASAPGFSVIVLTNSEHSDARAIASALMDLNSVGTHVHSDTQTEAQTEVRWLLTKAREERLDQKDIKYVRGGWRPNIPMLYRNLLDPLGHIISLRLIANYRLGDDECNEFEAFFFKGTRRVRYVSDPVGNALEFEIL